MAIILPLPLSLNKRRFFFKLFACLSQPTFLITSLRLTNQVQILTIQRILLLPPSFPFLLPQLIIRVLLLGPLLLLHLPPLAFPLALCHLVPLYFGIGGDEIGHFFGVFVVGALFVGGLLGLLHAEGVLGL